MVLGLARHVEAATIGWAIVVVLPFQCDLWSVQNDFEGSYVVDPALNFLWLMRSGYGSGS